MPRAKLKVSKSLEQAEAHLAEVDKQIKALRDQQAEVPLGLLKERRSANGAAARLRGDGRTLNERVILRSPFWARIKSAGTKALEPWPEAALAFAKALDEVEARSD